MKPMLSIGTLMGAARGGAGASILPKWKAAEAARAAGTRNSKLLFVGDSTIGGRGGQNLASSANDIAVAIPTKLAALMSAGSWQSHFGDHNTLIHGGSPTLPTWDPRFALGSFVQTLASANTVVTIGGSLLRCFSPNTTALTFTPTTSVDTFDLYYLVGPSQGAFKWQIDGGSVSSEVSTAAGSQSIQKLTIPAGSNGAHTLKIARSSGGSIYLVGFIAYNSASKEVTIINGGWSGSAAADWNAANGVWDPMLVLQTLAPDLTIICLTINDWVANTASAAFKASTQNIIDKAKLSGDVILLSGAPSQTTSASLVNQAAKIADYDALAASNGIRHINQTTLFTDWATANAASLTYDSLHYRAAANDITAAAIKAVLDAA